MDSFSDAMAMTVRGSSHAPLCGHIQPRMKSLAGALWMTKSVEKD